MADVRGVRQRAARPARRRARRVPARDRADARADDRGRGRESRTPGSRSPRTRDEIVDRAARQPHGRLPVHEVHGRGDGRRHGRGARRRDARTRRRARRPGRPPRLPPRLVRRDRSRARRRAPRPVAVAGDGGRGRQALAGAGRRHRRRRATSTSTRASRARCTSRATRSASRPPIPAASPSPAGWRTTAVPASGYLTHSIAAMVERLRADPGAFGLVSGVGMHMTKHVFGVYSTTPGALAPPDTVAIQRASTRTSRCPWSAARRATRPSPPTRSSTTATERPSRALLVCDLARRRAHVRDARRIPTRAGRAEEHGARRRDGAAHAAARSTGPLGPARVNRRASH